MIFFKRNIIYIFIFYCFFGFSQEKLTNQNFSWEKVLTGKVICKPLILEDRFIVLTDASSLECYSNFGILLWKTYYRKNERVDLQATVDNFILVKNYSINQISIFNPSGKFLTKIQLNEDFFDINTDFYNRIVIQTENYIFCYDYKGKIIWKIFVEKSKHLYKLYNNSFLILNSNNGNKNTSGKRISIFGEILEEIDFSEIIKRILPVNNGIFIHFENGNFGFFTIENNKSKSKWMILNEDKSSFFTSSQNKDLIIQIIPKQNNVKISTINFQNGFIENSFFIQEIDFNNIQFISLTNLGLFISDNKKCYFYKNQQKKWEAQIVESFEYIFSTFSNHIVFSKENWTLTSYRFYEEKNDYFQPEENFDDYFTIDKSLFDYLNKESFSKKLISSQIIDLLRNGDYGKNEIEISSNVYSACDLFFSGESKVFEKDKKGFQSILTQLILLSTKKSCITLANLIEQIDDISLLQIIFLELSKNPYDVENQILLAIQKKSLEIPKNQEKILFSICDVITSLCNFMGNQSKKMGIEILKEFLTQNYSEEVKKYARKSLIELR